MADMLVRSEIELSVPVAERHINAAQEAASYLTTDKSSIQIEIVGEGKNWMSMKTMRMAKAYIFDMDGTLVDNCAWHVKAWRAFAVRHGREITEQQILEWMGAPSAYYMNRIFDREIPPEECAALMKDFFRELRTRKKAGLPLCL